MKTWAGVFTLLWLFGGGVWVPGPAQPIQPIQPNVQTYDFPDTRWRGTSNAWNNMYWNQQRQIQNQEQMLLEMRRMRRLQEQQYWNDQWRRW